MNITRRAALSGIASVAATGATGSALAFSDSTVPLGNALLPNEQSGQALMWLDNVPDWRGPGLYEVVHVNGPRIVFIEPEPIQPVSDDLWFRASECLAHRDARGTWVMPSASLALMTIRKVGEIVSPLTPSEPLAP